MAEEISRGVGFFLSSLVVIIFKIIKGFILGVIQGVNGGRNHG